MELGGAGVLILWSLKELDCFVSSCGDGGGEGLGSVQSWRRREYEGTVGVWGSRRWSWDCFEDESDLFILLGETMVILPFRVFFALTALSLF